MARRENPFHIVEDKLRNDEPPKPLQDLLRLDGAEMLGQVSALHAGLFGLDRPKPRTLSCTPLFERVTELFDTSIGVRSQPNSDHRLIVRYSGIAADSIQSGQDDFHRRVYGTHFAVTHIAAQLVGAQPVVDKRIEAEVTDSEEPARAKKLLRWRAASALALTQVNTEREKRLLPSWYRNVNDFLLREYQWESLATGDIESECGLKPTFEYDRMPPQIQGILNPVESTHLEELIHDLNPKI